MKELTNGIIETTKTAVLSRRVMKFEHWNTNRLYNYQKKVGNPYLIKLESFKLDDNDIRSQPNYLQTVGKFLRGVGPVSRREDTRLVENLLEISQSILISTRESVLKKHLILAVHKSGYSSINFETDSHLPLSYHQFVNLGIIAGNESEVNEKNLLRLSQQIIHEIYALDHAKQGAFSHIQAIKIKMKLSSDEGDQMCGDIIDYLSQAVRLHVNDLSIPTMTPIKPERVRLIVDQIAMNSKARI